MKVAVTGASGFIGWHVLAELATRPVEVIAVVRRLPANLPLAPSGKVVQLDLARIMQEIRIRVDWGPEKMP